VEPTRSPVISLPGIGAIGLDDPLPGCTNFLVREFTHGGSRIPNRNNVPAGVSPEQVVRNAIALGKELEKVRSRYNAPIRINSWFRDTITNARVGGASRSQHLLGGAADFVVAGVHSQAVVRDLANWSGGLAGTRTNSFTHLDIRPYRARWTYPF
jgi:hypothetical protein